MTLRLLVVSQYWAPAQLAGGARSTARAVGSLAGAVDTWVLTGDRDVGDTSPWPDQADGSPAPGGWHDVDGVRVRYQRWDRRSARRVREAIDEIDPDVVYLPSVFAPGSLVVLGRRLAGRVSAAIVLAPEGELHPGALAHHRARKRVLLGLLRLTGVGRRVRWRAADEVEVAQIRAAAGPGAIVSIAPDLHAEPSEAEPPARPVKAPGHARVVFVGTIVPKKGLHRALELLWPVRHQIRFAIYGPVVDQAEWARCRAVLDRCEDGVEWRAHGVIPHDEVGRVLAGADLCILPTLGENYSYVIAEALGAGCPVLTSDQTPWQDLTGDGGWDLPLAPVEPWRACIDEVVAWDDDDRHRAGLAARRRFDRARTESAANTDAWRTLIEEAAAGTMPG